MEASPPALPTLGLNSFCFGCVPSLAQAEFPNREGAGLRGDHADGVGRRETGHVGSFRTLLWKAKGFWKSFQD